MSSSDLDLDAPTDSHYVSDKHRKQQLRKDALARLKRSHRSSTRPTTPRFLGGDDHDDDADAATQDVDFEQWERSDLERRRERRAAAASSSGSGSAPAPPRAARESDPALANAFDDLFDLGDDGIRTGEPALDVDGTGAVDVDGLDAEGAPAKKRRVVAKMDEVRLLGPSGFPRLRDDLKKVRIKGKGHELQDLKRVLSTYQLWAHQMYPKTNFRDTLVTIEKLCHKRTVQRALKEYRDDEKHGRSNADEQRERDAFADLDIPSTGLGLGGGAGEGGRATAPATLPGSRDLLAAAGFDNNDDDDGDDFFGGAGGEDDDDFLADEEALLAELEAEATASSTAAAGRAGGGAGPSAGAGAGAGPSRERVQLVEEEGFDEDDEVDEDAEAEAAMREAEEALMM